MEWVEGNPASGKGNGFRKLLNSTVANHQPFQQLGQRLAQAIGLKEVPVVKGGAIGQGEAGQEVIGVERRGLAQMRQTGGTNIAFAGVVGVKALARLG